MHKTGGRLRVNNQNISALGQITILTGPQAGRSFQLTKLAVTVGRDPTNDIVPTDPSVARTHARILYSQSVWSIEKLTDHNTVTVNQRDVQQSIIRHNDNIGLGGITTFLFLPASSIPNYVGPYQGTNSLPPIRSSSTPLPP